jgi:signal transduction histidine kinase
VEVDLLASGPSAELRVRDDGEGFQPAVGESSGLGLQGMAERARLVGGELDVRSAPGAGTEVTMRLP